MIDDRKHPKNFSTKLSQANCFNVPPSITHVILVSKLQILLRNLKFSIKIFAICYQEHMTSYCFRVSRIFVRKIQDYYLYIIQYSEQLFSINSRQDTEDTS